jgi:hypothetical protein
MLRWIMRPAAVTALVLGFAATAEAATNTAAETSTYKSASVALSGLAGSLVSNFENHTGPNGPRTYRHGVWTSSDEGCWVCNTGPAAADAVLALHKPSQLPVVVDTFDTAINTNQQPNGSFVGAGENPGINTIFFLQQLGDAYATLKNEMSPATLALWQSSIVAGANYLITSGNTDWYANGNLQLAVTEVMYIAWRASGRTRFLTAYNQSWQFTESPALPRWPGYGLMITTAPDSGSAYDADGAGYLTEDGSSGPGFDPGYTMLQLDVASELFVLSHDRRALTLMNILVNQELPLINKTNFVLDARNGSRDSLNEGFTTTALILLARYGRTDLHGDIHANVNQIESSYRPSLTYTSRNAYIGLARDFGPLLMDAAGVQVVPPPGAPTAYLVTSGASTSGVIVGTSSTSAFSRTQDRQDRNQDH